MMGQYLGWQAARIFLLGLDMQGADHWTLELLHGRHRVPKSHKILMFVSRKMPNNIVLSQSSIVFIVVNEPNIE